MTPTFREFLSGLVDAGEAHRVSTPVSWDLEASAVAMLANLADAPIPVFDAVESSDADARLVGDPYRGPAARPWVRLARAVGVDAESGADYYDAVISRLRSPTAPRLVDAADAPCKEVCLRGDDVDLLSFPWPYIHEGDGGRYSNLQTLVAPDPDGEWDTWSRHRAMVHGPREASLLFLAGERVPNLYYYGYERRGEPMPVAVVLGAPPAVTCAADMWIPIGRSEAAFAGGLAGESIPLVPCETNDLRVPASAELVVEGHVHPGERLDEGPFGDYFGYMNGPRRSMPALSVDAITHRASPYLPFCVEGTGVGYGHNSSSTLQLAASGPDATLGLRAAGFDVAYAVPWAFTSRTVWVIATDRPAPGYLHDLANFVYTTWGMLHIDCFVFVDADVDPFDPRAVLEALALYADPDEDFRQFGVERMPKVPLNIYQTPDEKGSAAVGTSQSKTAKAYVDATRPEGEDAPPRTLGDRETRRRAQRRLAEAGLDERALDLLDDPGDASGGDGA